MGAALENTTITPQRSISSEQLRGLALILPSVILIVALFVVPLGRLTLQSFTYPELGLHNYIAALTDPLIWKVLFITFQISAIVTAACLVIGYAVALSLTLASPRLRRLMFFFVLVPFWTSTLIKSYAWVIILSRRGVLNTLFAYLAIPEQSLIYNRTGTIIGMVYIMLPYMILSLYPVMISIDKRLSEASASLGASDFEGFCRIFLPLSAPGIFAGSLIVMILSLGFFITPALLGSPRDLMVSVYIDVQIERLLNWGMATSVSVILLVITIALTIALRRIAIKNPKGFAMERT
ncbi:MAG: ABC transporter permease [Parvibaculaceae bacterium]